MSTLNEVPWLRAGVGETPAQGGCIMQVIDWIHHREWTEHPPCVLSLLREIAVEVNDSLDDVGRQKLLDLAPRLMGTSPCESWVSEALEQLWLDLPEANYNLDMLVKLLDEFDRLTGRTKTPELDFSGVCEVMRA